jgi:hypothetical protein
MKRATPGPGQLGLFDRPPPPDPVKRRVREKAKRDGVLDVFAATRAALIRRATEIALKLATDTGTVTSVQVFDVMRSEGLGPMLDEVDPRWIGAVFREGNGWRRKTYISDGSHGRPVSVWERKGT